MKLANDVVFSTGLDLGIVVSVCNAEGLELAVAYGKGRKSGICGDAIAEAADLRSVYVDGEVVRVEPLTDNGRAFLELVA